MKEQKSYQAYAPSELGPVACPKPSLTGARIVSFLQSFLYQRPDIESINILYDDTQPEDEGYSHYNR